MRQHLFRLGGQTRVRVFFACLILRALPTQSRVLIFGQFCFWFYRPRLASLMAARGVIFASSFTLVCVCLLSSVCAQTTISVLTQPASCVNAGTSGELWCTFVVCSLFQGPCSLMAPSFLPCYFLFLTAPTSGSSIEAAVGTLGGAEISTAGTSQLTKEIQCGGWCVTSEKHAPPLLRF